MNGKSLPQPEKGDNEKFDWVEHVEGWLIEVLVMNEWMIE